MNKVYTLTNDSGLTHPIRSHSENMITCGAEKFEDTLMMLSKVKKLQPPEKIDEYVEIHYQIYRKDIRKISKLLEYYLDGKRLLTDQDVKQIDGV